MATKNVYVTVPGKVVRKVDYTDKKTGEPKFFYGVRLPSGVVVDGVDLAGGEFTRSYMYASRRGEEYRDFSFPPDKEVWVKVPRRDANGEVVRDAEGNWVKDTHKVMPAALKEAVDKTREDYLAKMAEKAAASVPEEPEPQGESQGETPWDCLLEGEDIDF